MKKVYFKLSDGPNFVWQKSTSGKIKKEFFKLIDSLNIDYNLVPANPFDSEYNFAFNLEEINRLTGWFSQVLKEHGKTDKDYLLLQENKKNMPEEEYREKLRQFGIDSGFKQFVSELVYHVYLNRDRRFLKDFYFFTVTDKDISDINIYHL